MNTKVNYHTHTYRCKHAQGCEEDYVKAAIEKGITTLGFSDHAPYSDDRFGFRMDFSELHDYINTVLSLRDKYKDQINILLGLEIEYDRRNSEYYEYLLNDLKLDYLAFGQHIFDKNNEFINTYVFTSTNEYIDYANSIEEALGTGYFAFLAHPDLIFVNDLPWDENCEKACDIIINAAIKNNSILEFNANGLRRGLTDFCDGQRYQYPHKKFWEKVSGSNIKVIINSDCHEPNQVWDEYMDMAYRLAKEWNLNVITEIL